MPSDLRSHFDGNSRRCLQNAIAQSVFSSLKSKLIERSSFESKAQARMTIFT
jgi:hypothetical protein